jgi:hypothetical protein
MATGGWNGAVGKDTLDAPGGVVPLHVVPLVPACGETVTGGPGLKAESPVGLGVTDPSGPGVGATLPAGVGVWEDIAVGTEVTGGDDCGVLTWLGNVLAAVISGLTGTHEALGDVRAPLPGTLPFGVAVPPGPVPPVGCPLPVLPGLSVPLGPAAGAVPPDTDDAMFTIACRTPGTASAVPAKKTTAARASTGLSQIVPARCPAARAPFTVAAAARRPAAAAAAATASA